MKKTKFKNHLVQLLATSLFIGTCSNSALAAILSVPAVAPISSATTDWTNTLQFPRFNPALGALISVEIDLSTTLNTTLTITNSSPTVGSSGSAKTELQLSVQDAGNHLNVPEIDLFSPAYSYALAAGQSSTSPLLTKTGTSSDIYTSLPILAEFTGSGNISLNASTFTATFLANTGGNTTSGQFSSANANGNVVYTYNPVPEPATATLLGIASVGFAASRRRRRA